MIKIKLNRDTEITGSLAATIIQKWGHLPLNRFKLLGGYYTGEHEILKRSVADKKPNNKILVNRAKLITDNATGYFMGIPVTYESDEKNQLQQVFDIMDANFEEDINFEIAKDMSIKGVGYELVYADEEAQVRFKNVSVEEIIPVYSDDINEELLFAIRFYQTEDIMNSKKTDRAEVYTDAEIIIFESKNGLLTEVDRMEHFFGDVPIIEYLNNEEKIGDFEVVLSMIDAYNKSQSDSANDFEEFTDAFLALTGMEGTELEDVEELKEKRVLLLAENGQAQWLVKTINDTAIENYKSRLKDDTHSISQVPDLADEKFAGNVSGEAMKYKLWGLEQITSTKERKFKTGLVKRLKLITHFLNIKGASYNYNDINLKFHRNIPENVSEAIKNAQAAGGVVSEKTRMSLLPFVDDVDAELKRKQEDDARTLGQIYDNATKII